MKLYKTYITIIFISLVFTLQAGAKTQTEKGLAIAEKADRKNKGYIDSDAQVEMILRNAEGETSIRILNMRSLEVADDGDKTLVVFRSPPDIKGMSLLSFSHKQGSDDQWLYLPAIKRVKRIASQNKSGPFVGSEFAYEDLSSQEVEKYRYKFLREELYNKKDCYVIERYPVDEYSGYSRQVVWYDKNEYRIWRIKYYDKKNSLLKTLVNKEFKLYENKYWRPMYMHMENHQTEKSTLLEWRNIKFLNGYAKGDFNRTSLKRMR